MKKNQNIDNPDKAFFLSDITEGLKAKQKEYYNNKENSINIEEKISELKSVIKRHKPK